MAKSSGQRLYLTRLNFLFKVTMNIFEGARRVAIVFGALGAFGGLFAAFQQEPTIQYNYRIADYGVSPIKSDTCDYIEDATKEMSYTNEDGSRFNVRLCFAASRADNGQLMVPFASENGRTLMGGRYTPQVKNYVETYAETKFKLSQADFEKAKSDYSSQKIHARAYAVGAVVGGLLLYWLCICAIGWIVRGFLGIPNGADHRVTTTRSTT